MGVNMKRVQTDCIIKKLIKSGTTISTMESCTSGLIASMITDTEGASAIFPGGYVTYLNETKIFVGVDENIIKKYVATLKTLESAEVILPHSHIWLLVKKTI